MVKVKLTIREINGALSVLKITNQDIDIQKELEAWMSSMLKEKMQCFEIDADNPICKYVKTLFTLHNQLVRVQKRRR